MGYFLIFTAVFYGREEIPDYFSREGLIIAGLVLAGGLFLTFEQFFKK